jgi:hypothetical protein
MISAKDEQIIAEVVNEKMQAGEQFTAYDVTLSARKRGMGERHLDARRKVHEQIGFQGTLYNYLDTNIKITDKGQDKGIARLYYPVGSDLTKYRQVGSPIATAISDDSSSDDDTFDADTDSDSDSDDTRVNPRPSGHTKYDHAGRYTVKSGIVRSAGFNEGDNVRVNVEHGKITITKNGTRGVDYVVNNSGGIRLAQKRLTDAFARLPVNIQISVGDQLLVLTE